MELGLNDNLFTLLSLSSSVCPMGGSSSRLFGTLAQSLNSAPLAQPEAYPEENPDQDPEELLRECEEVLQRRPARPHRNLVYPSSMAPRHKHNSSIRIMQWNILAQGRDVKNNRVLI